MKISYRWLKEYVATDLSPKAVADRLTNAGIEVGEVEAIDKHGGCRVATADRHFTVVCGAPNVAVGVRAAFAPPGAALPGGRQVQATRKRGGVSAGMLCSEKELGVGDAADGILLLAGDAPLGRA